MRLHRLRTHNLASLYGEQSIDFDGDLASARLFLIVGQTGAGKSTLLDAISLALYGRTPRLASAASSSNPDSVSRIMSDGSGRCGVELDFSVRDAQGSLRRYRAAWTCWRARDRADGAVQKPQQTLEEVDAAGASLRVLAEGRKQAEFDAARDAVLDGLTFDELRRSMLLAQGEFAAFLKADEKERTSILERLTAVTQYRDIGRRAAERHRAAQERVRALRSQSEGVELLGDDAIAALEAARTQARATAAEHAARVAEIERAQQWQTALAKLEQGVAGADEAVASAARAAEEAAPDLARLRAHEQCAPAKPALDAVDRAAAQMQAGVAALDEATAAHQRAQAVLGERATERDAARAALDARHAEAQSVVQALPAARAAHEARRRADALHDDAAKRMTTLEGEHDVQKQATDKARRKWRKAADALDEARKQRDRLRAGGALDAAWDEQVAPASTAYGGALLSWKTAKEAAERTADAAAKAASARQGTHAKVIVEERRAEGVTEALAAAQAARAQALGGTASAADARAAWQAQIDEARARLAQLEAIGTAAHAERKAAHLLSERDVELAARQAAVDDAVAACRAAEERLAGLGEQAKAHAGAVRSMEQALKFVDARRELVAGEACPVCGATEHPAAGDDADGIELERQLAEQREALDAAQERVVAEEGALAAQQASASAAREARAAAHAQVELARSAQVEAAEAFRRAREAAGLADDDGFAFEAQQADAHRAQRHAEAAMKALGEAERALEQARAAVDAAQPELARARELAAEARARAEAAQAEADRAGAELLERDAERTLQAGRFRDVLVSLGVPVAGTEPKDLEHAAADAERLRRQWNEQAEVIAEAEKKVAEREAKAHTEARVLDELTRNLTPARDGAREAEVAAEQAAAEVARHFGGRAPDAVEHDVREAEAGARTALEAAERALAEASKAEAASASAAAERQAALVRAQEQLASDEQALAEALATLELAHADALRAALLDDEALRALRARRDAVEALRTEAAAAKVAAERALAEHRGAPVARSGAPSEALVAERGEAEKTEEGAQREVGALEERLRAQDQARARLAEVAEALSEAHGELALWSRIHELIGRNDGDAFARLAQILNLAELVEHANERLAHLTRRYRLTVRREDDGRPTLDFAVRDAEQGDRERSVSTLSGGETFLVSLGLALSLADFRSTRLPIETLLLDEGFGTLDPDTLSVAMSALERLHQISGASIGIISHVEALRERVDAQIVVEAQGGGRSVVRVATAR